MTRWKREVQVLQPMEVNVGMTREADGIDRGVKYDMDWKITGDAQITSQGALDGIELGCRWWRRS